MLRNREMMKEEAGGRRVMHRSGGPETAPPSPPFSRARLLRCAGASGLDRQGTVLQCRQDLTSVDSIP